jgi:hypothetical protein
MIKPDKTPGPRINPSGDVRIRTAREALALAGQYLDAADVSRAGPLLEQVERLLTAIATVQALQKPSPH